MRIELTIAVDYQPEWGIWEGVREVISNAMDGETRLQGAGGGKGRMSLTYDKGTKHLIVRNDGVKLQVKHLLMGAGDNKGRSDTIGTFGEGLPMALLTLSRTEGVGVIVKNRDETWRVKIAYSKRYEADVVVIATKPSKDIGGLEVHITGLEFSDYQLYRERFLRLSREFDPVSTVKPDDYSGRILIQKKFRGRIYNKGVYVASKDDLRYGFDLHEELNRDRNIMDGWMLKLRLAHLVSNAIAKKPEEFGEDFLEMLDEGTALEVQYIDAFTQSAPVREYVANAFREKHGTDAIPVSTMDQSEKVHSSGGTSAFVSDSTRAVLEASMGGFQTAVRALDVCKIDARYDWHELSYGEREFLTNCVKLVRDEFFEAGLEAIEVVDFSDPGTKGSYTRDTGKIALSRCLLSDFSKLSVVLAHEIAHESFGDGSYKHSEKQIDILGHMVGQLFSVLGD